MKEPPEEDNVTQIDLALLDKSLNDHVPCEVAGCQQMARLRGVRKCCKYAELYCLQHGGAIQAKLVFDSMHGSTWTCREEPGVIRVPAEVFDWELIPY